MPYVDYNEWYKREQERRRQLGLDGAVGALRENQVYQPYKPSNSSIMQNQGKYALDVGTKAATGFAFGGPIGAVVAAAPTVIKEYPKMMKGAKKSFEQGDWEAGTSQTNVISAGINTAWDKWGLPDWTNPNYGVGKLASAIFSKPRTKVEEARWKKLREAGFDVPKWVDANDTSQKGTELNPIFQQSRNEADLRPEDISQFATNYENFGQNWGALSDADRNRIMQLALDNKLVREHKGTVDINWTPEVLTQAENIIRTAIPETEEEKQRRAKKYWVAPSEAENIASRPAGYMS